MLQRAVEGLGEVCGGVGRAQMHLESALGERNRDRGGDGALADASLAHAQDQPVVIGGKAVDQVGQRRVGEIPLAGGDRVLADEARTEEGLQRVHADHVRGFESDLIDRQAA